MDAVKFIKEKERLCKAQFGCDKCPLFDNCERVGNRTCNPEEAVRIVEEWSKAHPIQTNADKFKEVFGWSPYNSGGDYINAPYDMLWTWWDAPYEAPKAVAMIAKLMKQIDEGVDE